MRRISRLHAILLPALFILPACGGGGDASKQAGTKAVPDKPAATTARQASPGRPGREAIPEPRELGDPEPGIKLVPRFSDTEDITTLAVAPGDRFELYICAEHPQRDMASATYRLDVPEGVEILGEAKLHARSLSLGTYAQYFVVTYPCHGGDEAYPVLRYTCMITPSFTGGTFKVDKAVPVNSDTEPPFLGFVGCGDSPDMIPAAGGEAELTLK